MKKFYLFFAFLALALGWTAAAQAEDVVYLKDGSVIHGTITEEVPGTSIKIETADGNVFVYKVRLISKITHGDAAAQAAPADENVAPEENPGDTTVVVVKKRRGPGPGRRFVNDFKSDPNAGFSVGSFYFGAGIASAGIMNQYNSILTSAYGSSNYNFIPAVYSGNIGLGWFTNHIGIKWTGTFGFNQDYEQTDYYYGAYYVGSTYINNLIDVYGSELEVDLSLDDVQTSATHPNAKRVLSVYVPLIAGYWAANLLNQNTGYNWYGTTVDYGSGLGVRFIGEDHIMFDIQCIGRVDNPGKLYNTTYGYIVLPNGKNMTADVSGVALNFDMGFTF